MDKSFGFSYCKDDGKNRLVFRKSFDFESKIVWFSENRLVLRSKSFGFSEIVWFLRTESFGFAKSFGFSCHEENDQNRLVFSKKQKKTCFISKEFGE